MKKTINLINKNISSVDYKLGRFPDGEPYFEIVGELNRKDEYDVICRITSPEELFILMEVGDILDRNGVVWELHIKYLMGMRMDRVMDFNRPFSLRVIGKMISSLGYTNCYILTPHSNRTLTEIRNSTGVEVMPHDFVVYNYEPGLNFEPDLFVEDSICDCVCLVYPDAGSMARYTTESDTDGIDYIHFDKTRDIETGKILNFDLHQDCEIYEDTEFLFYDDLCDGGGTFIGELEVLKKVYPGHRFSIRVTHLVNERGLKALCENFDMVYITDSYRDWKSVADELGYDNVRVL